MASQCSTDEVVEVGVLDGTVRVAVVAAATAAVVVPCHVILSDAQKREGEERR